MKHGFKELGGWVFSKLIQHRMKSTRVLIGMITLLMLFTRPWLLTGRLLETFLDWTGYFLVLFACLGRIFSSVFICGTKNEKLSTQGPFSMVRNPLYVFSFFAVLGAGFLSGRLIILVLLLWLFFLYYPGVVAHEETYLRQTFGDLYETYQNKVPRWFPRTLKMDLPEVIPMYPRLLLQTMRDTSLFFLIFPMTEVIERLHDLGMLPMFFPLM